LVVGLDAFILGFWTEAVMRMAKVKDLRVIISKTGMLEASL
jgi:hypothetical protein